MIKIRLGKDDVYEVKYIETLERNIYYPMGNLKSILDYINRLLNEKFSDIIAHPGNFGYIRGKCAAMIVWRNRNPDLKVVYQTDISSFFDNITKDKFLNCETLLERLSIDEVKEISKAIFHKDILATGTVVAPIVSNIILSKLDKWFSYDRSISYNRYVDDISIFSNDYELLVKDKIPAFERRINELGFKLKKEKTRIVERYNSNIFNFTYRKASKDSDEIILHPDREKELLASFSDNILDVVNGRICVNKLSSLLAYCGWCSQNYINEIMKKILEICNKKVGKRFSNNYINIMKSIGINIKKNIFGSYSIIDEPKSRGDAIISLYNLLSDIVTTEEHKNEFQIIGERINPTIYKMYTIEEVVDRVKRAKVQFQNGRSYKVEDIIKILPSFNTTRNFVKLIHGNVKVSQRDRSIIAMIYYLLEDLEKGKGGNNAKAIR